MKPWLKRGIAILIAVLLALGVLFPVLNLFTTASAAPAGGGGMSPNTGDEGMPGWILPVLIVAAVVVLAAIIVAIVRTRKKED